MVSSNISALGKNINTRKKKAEIILHINKEASLEIMCMSSQEISVDS
jgi:aspartokinase